jgi:AcrR family transcriptional regulator
MDAVNILWLQELQKPEKNLMEPSLAASSHAVRPYHHGGLRSALIEAAMTMLTEEQNWNFSLREVASRAGVSHNAPYNHFADKRELLVAVASLGFARLRERMLSALAGARNPKTALIGIGVAYVEFGLQNPAHYRLMFGPALSSAEDGRPSLLMQAAAGARSVLDDTIARGAQAGVFAVSPRNKRELQVAALTAFSTVHGLTMIAIDGLAGVPRPMTKELAEKVARTIGHGLFRK